VRALLSLLLLILACAPRQAVKTAEAPVFARFPQEGIGTVVVPIPDYPELALRSGIEGLNIISSVVNRDGLVERPRVRQSSGNSSLDSASVTATQGTRLEFWPSATRRPFLLDITYRYLEHKGTGLVSVEDIYLREE
jgi:TonB family protein